jgi:hypothetical protein
MSNHDQKDKNELLVYTPEAGLPALNMAFDGETLWLTLKQIADLFQTTQDNVRSHIKNIYSDNELDVSSTSKKIYGVVENRPNYGINHYNLDVVISVGYRISSKVATEFRKWATNVLRERIGQNTSSVPGLSRDEQRLMISDRVAVENNELLDTAIKMGVENQHTFFESGYRGMYKERMDEIKKKKGIGNDRLLDRAGITELAANEFRITQTNDKLQKQIQEGKLVGEVAAISTHHDVGKEVREAIERIGGVPPEELPVEPDHIDAVRKRIAQSSQQTELLES